jgi:hypothetical protein
MATLRADVDAEPLPDVRFVKARGRARRRQRLLTWGAAAAAAVVVAGVAGYAALGTNPSPAPLPPQSRSTTSAPSPTSTGATGSLDQPGALPLAPEWKQALGLTGTVRLTPVKPFGPVECLSSEPGTKVQQEQVTTEGVQFEGGQVRFAIGAGQDVATAGQGVTSDIAGCRAGPGFKVTPYVPGGPGARGPYRPWKLFSYAAGDAGSGWFAVVTGPHDVALLQVVEPSSKITPFTAEQVTRLAQVAQQRLARYGTGTSSTPTTSSPTVNGPKAIDEQMPVSGPDPKPSSKLFVAASQWTSQALTGAAKAYAGPGALEGSTAIAQCETDEQQAGIGGKVGVVSVRTGNGAAGYIGRERVQLDESSEPSVQKAYVQARLTEAKALYAKGCSFPNGKVTSTPGPTAGTWRLDTVFNDGSPTQSEWVGVTAQQTPGAVTTVVITRAADPKQGFAELDRLLALARQK